MQKLGLKILESIKDIKMKRLEVDLKDECVGGLIICPLCNYVSKNKKGSAKIFESDGKKSFKCFACGMWRKL